MWRINDRLAADLESGRFVTAFLGFVDPDGTLTWAGSGHGPIVLRQAGGSRVLQSPWPPLGLMSGDANPPPAPIQLLAGYSLAFLSDGITEAFNARGDWFGIERVLAALESSGADPESALTAVRDAVIRWQGKDEPLDDQTIVVVMREG
jgi:sigma-B regulation protein RsbU (phosphoserine phosphatase)